MTINDIWRKLRNKKYREDYAVAFLKRSVAFQIKTLRKKHCGSQAVLAERAKLTQGVVSRAEDQDYGNLTFNTVGRIGAGLDIAFIGRFVPFSELVKFSRELSEEEFRNILNFEEEDAAIEQWNARSGVSSSVETDQVIKQLQTKRAGMMSQPPLQNEQKVTGEKVRTRREKKTKRRAVSSLPIDSERTYRRDPLQGMFSPAA